MPFALDVQFIFLQLAVSIGTYLLFLKLRRSVFRVFEPLLCITLLLIFAILPIILISLGSAAAIISNVASIIVMTAIAYNQRNGFSLSAVYAFFAIIIMLLTANVSNLLLAIASLVLAMYVPQTAESIVGHLMFSVLYIVISFSMGLLVAHKLGKVLKSKMENLDVFDHRKLARALLFVAVITLTFFFVFTHLRFLPISSATETLVYTLVIALGFGGSLFSLFMLSDNINIAKELQHKDDLLHHIQEHTAQQERVTTEMAQFRHDHKNLLLGTRGFMDDNDHGNEV